MANRTVTPVLATLLVCAYACAAHAESDTPFETLIESESGFVINSGLNDAWFNPATSGQGFLITVYPDIQQLFLAWFTFDTEDPTGGAAAILGDSSHRWLTAQGPYEGSRANLTVYLTEGGVFDAATPAAATDLAGVGTLTLDFADCTQGLVTYEISSLGIAGEIPLQRIAGDNVALCNALWKDELPECTRPEPDISHGPNNPVVQNGNLVNPARLMDGGPGPDGIPALESPLFNRLPNEFSLSPVELVVGVKIGQRKIRAYPHYILDWHEIVNDDIIIDKDSHNGILSYCPLTGSAVFWKSFPGSSNKTFGVSGLLYNSNLVLYDRETESLWSQMMEQSISGPEVTTIPERIQVVETTWETWYSMYPTTSVLSDETGYSRPYEEYPYGKYKEDEGLLFEVDNMDDRRLHRKARVVGINVGDHSKVYPIEHFDRGVEVINDTVGGMDVVAVGSRVKNFGVIYNRQMEDCKVLQFEAVQNRLPVMMVDNEGNEWDIFGEAVSGPRAGERLQKTNSYISYFFAWTAFFPGSQIHQ